MAQPRTKEGETQRRQTAQDVFIDKLTRSGYTADQARQILSIVQRMRRGENVQLNPTQSTWLSDINSVNAAWSEVSPSTRRLSQLSASEAGRISAGLLLAGPERPAAPVVREVAASAPGRTRTWQYTVTVNGAEYTVQTNRELVARGLTSVPASRIGQLRGMLLDNPNAVLGITTPDGNVITPGTPAFHDFTQTYLLAYRDKVSDPASDAIIIARR